MSTQKDKKVALAIMAHPDDIEWRASGTLMKLKEQGWETHYLSVANGCYGTREHSYEDIVRIRREESKQAAEFIGTEYHESLSDDLGIYHTEELVKKVAAVVRKVQPDVILTHPLNDYMEDHINTGRLAATAAFARAAINYQTIPEVDAYDKDVCIYMAQPHRLHDRMRNPVLAELYIDATDLIMKKAEAICLHKSQEAWLADSQGTATLADGMIEDACAIGRQSHQFECAEGWNRHYHVGYSSESYDPLFEALRQDAVKRNTQENIQCH